MSSDPKPDEEQVKKIQEYIEPVFRMPLEGISQLVSMVILHFDIPDKEADRLVWEAICQLFPKPKVQWCPAHGYPLPCDKCGLEGIEPDGGRLLKDEEMAEVQGDKDRCLAVIHGFDTCKGCSAYCHAVAKAQDAKTASIKEAEIREIIREAEDKGVIPSEMEAITDGCRQCLDWWQALKSNKGGG